MTIKDDIVEAKKNVERAWSVFEIAKEERDSLQTVEAKKNVEQTYEKWEAAQSILNVINARILIKYNDVLAEFQIAKENSKDAYYRYCTCVPEGVQVAYKLYKLARDVEQVKYAKIIEAEEDLWRRESITEQD